MRIGMSVKRQDEWRYGFFKKYRWYAKTYIEKSSISTDKGQVSKLYIYTPKDECICQYDRGWIITPNRYDAKIIYHSVLKLVSDLI